MSFIRALKYYSLEYPFYFYGIALGAVGPAMVLTVLPLRRNSQDYKRIPDVPTTYPMPNRARLHPAGYDD
ncbi:n19m, NADH-ubiquinone oxidoreductase 9.5 kDa subunit [Entomophthora muscae]|uniref:N19m, NADH-ubiquinone oxidoreductase 9.5 kDa subunit n=1 Tax=Entomophthora muscae TaxID=34485 RepID=A0ACC2S777_9FUNG|nr:n19m, NADH-ubiquinone oxidoreductase 9.5 kDa subunit [Entomophthora muscae]